MRAVEKRSHVRERKQKFVSLSKRKRIEASLMTDVVEIVGGADDELAASVPPV